MIRATSITHTHETPDETVTLTYDDRFRRRMAMVGDGGLEFLLDLPKAAELRQGDDLVLEDGRRIRVQAAEEPLMRVSGETPHALMRITWHIGNRHLPCEIFEDHLILRQDHVIRAMLTQLGAEVDDIVAPFNPEGGAYGKGRTQPHEH